MENSASESRAILQSNCKPSIIHPISWKSSNLLQNTDKFKPITPLINEITHSIPYQILQESNLSEVKS